MSRDRPIARRIERPYWIGSEHFPNAGGWFTSGASYWRDVYNSDDLDGDIYRRRLNEVIRWVESLKVSSAKALDAGCGAGDVATHLGRRGWEVVASDLSRQMLDLTRHGLEADGLGNAVVQADAHRLPFPDEAFNLVVALGLMPWVRSPADTALELARVTHKNGYVILSFDNAFRLFRVLDPGLTPLTEPVRCLLRRVQGREYQGNRLLRPAQGRSIAEFAGLEVVAASGVGFGPPTFMSRPFLSQRLARRLNAKLQRRSTRNARLYSRLGAHYVLLLRRKV
jgi:ubiquinone/menaquinone biosynthesis C-methylase UbiE